MTTPILVKSPPWQLMMVSSVHLMWAGCLLWYPPLSQLIIFIRLDWLNKLGLPLIGGSPAYMQAVILALTSVLALGGIYYERYLTRMQVIATLAPQYGLVLISLGFDAVTILQGYRSATGAMVDRPIVVALLGVFIVVAIFHTLAVAERYGYNWTGK